MIQDREIFVTGGFGFIGSALVERLLPENRVTVFDSGHRCSPRFEALQRHPNLTVVKGDILDQAAVQAAIGTPDLVVHMAAVAGVSSYYRAPLRTMEVNLIGTRHVLEAALTAGSRLQRFVNLSTSEVFGPHAWRAKEAEGTAQGDPAERRWTYSISKLAGEKLALAYHWERDLPVVSLRPFNVYGPGQVGEGAIQIFVRRALANEPIEVTGDGIQIRSWCYIDDMVSAVEAALVRPAAVGRVYNIGNPQATVTTVELANRIRRIAGSTSRVVLVPHVGVDIDLRVPDISRAQADLGYEPGVDLDEGLRRAVQWYRETAVAGEDRLPHAGASGDDRHPAHH
jgi:nucleoside-diphosphate-sugar epimerase